MGKTLWRGDGGREDVGDRLEKHCEGEMVAEWQVSGGNSGAKEEEGRQNGKWVEGIVGNVGNVGVRWTKPCGWDG